MVWLPLQGTECRLLLAHEERQCHHLWSWQLQELAGAAH